MPPLSGLCAVTATVRGVRGLVAREIAHARRFEKDLGRRLNLVYFSLG